MKLRRRAKTFIREVALARGYEIIPRSSNSGQPLDVLSLLLEFCVLKHGPGFVLQIGANDGVMGDPVRDAVLRLQLPALFVEPLPDLFESLQRNYADHPGAQFANFAVSSTPGHADLYRVIPSATQMPDWAYGLASFDKSVLLKHKDWEGVGPNFEECIEMITVPVLTIAQLLDAHADVDPILLLQIDTEGHDLEVIRSAVEAECLPPLINYEHKHLNHRDQEACRELLASHGYSFESSRVDTIAFKDQLS